MFPSTENALPSPAYPRVHIGAYVCASVQALPCSSEVDVDVFLHCSLPYTLRHGLSLNLELANSATVADQ